MPFLRFSRDKRGYETTALMHSFRGRGDARPRLLYWYRTPPDVKVGRAAIDEEAIRALEESNPELTFDWSRILHSHARPQPADRRPDRRSEVRVEGRPARRSEVARPVEPGAAPPVLPRPPESPETVRAKGRRRRRRGRAVEAPQLPFQDDSRPAEGTPEANLLTRDHEAGAEAVPSSPALASVPVAEAQASGDAEETPDASSEIAAHGSALEGIRHEDQARLRARYAEIQARISQRVTDPQRLEKLRALAEQLNPDAWVTGDDVASGLAEFEAVHSALKSMLGRRRRSRRGGVRHRRGNLRGPAPETAAPPTPELPHPEQDSKSGAGGDASGGGPPDEE